jgi:alpha-tubulin suppressor-like RCC1 family protein
LFLPKSGDIFALGWNKDGQCGEPSRPVISGIPIPVVIEGSSRFYFLITGKKFIDCAAGHYHSLLLNSEGTVYAFGSNKYGQLGISSFTSSGLPQQLTGSEIKIF